MYGQLLLDEFLLKELRAGKGWWGNKFGFQIEGKYIDVFKVKNLDVQGEVNVTRPFTYSHYDSSAGYSHYNQPLAHPFGANFIEAIGIIKYQPLPKLTTSARLIYWRQGVDSGAANYGGNILNYILHDRVIMDINYPAESRQQVLTHNCWLVMK